MTLDEMAVRCVDEEERRQKERQEKGQNTDPIPLIINLADVEPEEVKFLWEPYLPLGKLTLLEGDPGLGKTFLALNLCAAISNGWPLPGQDGKPGQPMEPGNILYLTAEDGLADTLVPRLAKMGADMSKIKSLTGYRLAEQGEERTITLANVDVFRLTFKRVKPVLVVIDPLQAFLGRIDMHRANETRPLLAGLAKLAEDFNCAILIIRHLSKGGAKAIYRGLGSIDFTAAARSVILVGEEPESGKKAMAHTKSSCAEKGVTMGFEITDEKGFLWTGISNCTAEDILTPPGINNGEEKTALGDAIEFLYEVLSDEPLEVKEIKSQAKQAGIGWRTIERAKTELGFKAHRSGKSWYWPQLFDNSSTPQFKDGGLGGLLVNRDITSFTERPPSPPNEKSDGVEQSKIVVRWNT